MTGEPSRGKATGKEGDADAPPAETSHRLYRPTSVFITHRLGPVPHLTNRILVIDKGELVEQGRHDQLLLKKGVYAELFNLQSDAFVHAGSGTHV